MAILDHHGVVDARHVGHAAVAMARIEIAAEKDILFRGWLGGDNLRHKTAIYFGNPAKIPRGAEFLGLDTDRHTGAAALASRPVSNRLRTPKSGLRELVI